MTHIDSKTITSSIQQIFDEFKQLKVDPNEVKVIVLGGWITSRVCNQMADDLLRILKASGCQHQHEKYVC